MNEINVDDAIQCEGDRMLKVRRLQGQKMFRYSALIKKMTNNTNPHISNLIKVE